MFVSFDTLFLLKQNADTLFLWKQNADTLFLQKQNDDTLFCRNKMLSVASRVAVQSNACNLKFPLASSQMSGFGFGIQSCLPLMNFL